MTPEQFVYWLQGALEIMDPKQLDEKQIQIIKDHIALVLKKETPNRSLQIPIIADPKMKEGDWKITTQTLPAISTKTCACPKGTFCGCHLAARC